MAEANGKDVLYVDVDDEITGIIDKVTQSQSKIVALVLPKRATVFQSIVNMKLLKKRADAAKKNLVLITSETGLLPLAGSVGLYVAKTLQSKPEIPSAPAAIDEVPEDVDEAIPLTGESFDPKQSADKPVGELAGQVPSSTLNADQSPEDTIELDNTTGESAGSRTGDGKDVAAIAAAGASGKAGGKSKKGKDKHLKVPNFDKFRMVLMLGALILALLVVGWIVANRVLPKASVTIQTDTTTINSNLNPTLDTTADSVDPSSQTVPAKVEQVQKTYTGQAPASGKKNEGNEASGSLTFTAQECGAIQSPDPIPAGSGVSANGLTFITQTDANFSLTGLSNGNKCLDFTSDAVGITAQNGGSQYNVGDGTNFTVAGRSDVTATGSATGGTDNIVTVVQQSDIDSAKKQAEQGISNNALKSQLQQALQGDGYYAISETFNAGQPQTNISAKAGDQVANVTYTENVIYTMFGTKQSDLHQLIAANVDQQIDTSKQTIQDDGLSNANITVPNPGGTSKVQIDLQVSSVVGPHIDQAALKSAIAGKKSGDAEGIIKANPGVNNVSVKLSPFWVEAVPTNTTKITFKIEKATSDGS